jgi:prepilin-type N-terminal cleavage/methylation domain-containing protein
VKPNQRGVTLLEMVVVIAVVATAAVSLGGLFANSVATLPHNERLQRAAQLAQGCAERIYTARHTADFEFDTTPALLESAYCGLPESAAAFTLAITSDSAGAACLSGLVCRQLVISVSDSASPGMVSRVDLLLVKP